MSLLSPAEGWYYKKVSKDEKMWMIIALILCIMLFVWMVMWHVYGKQNPSSTTYKTSTIEFAELTENKKKTWISTFAPSIGEHWN